MFQRRRWIAVAGLGLALVGLTVSACSGDAPSSSKPGSSSAGAFADGWSVAGALGEVPAVAAETNVLIQTADLDAATKAAGLTRPTAGSREATMPWLLPLAGGTTGSKPSPVFVPLAESFNLQSASPDEFADVLGWSVNDVDAFVEQLAPPLQFAVVSGDFTADTLAADLTAVDADIVTDVEAADFETKLDQVNAVSRLGRPTRLAEQDGLIALGTATPAVRAWLDGGPTLADDKALVAVAAALDDEDVVSAVVARVESGVDPAAALLGSRATPEQLAQLSVEIDAMVPQDPFDAVAIGWSVDDGQAEIHVAYHFTSEAGADSGAGVLEKAWRDGVSPVTRTPYSDRLVVDEVDVDGALVTVSLGTTDKGTPQLPYQMLQQLEPVFVSR